MSVAFTSMDNDTAGLAQDLAALRTSTGGKVLLVSSTHRLKRLAPEQQYDDVVFDISGSAPFERDSVLSLAGVIVVLVRATVINAARHCALLKCIQDAADANPHARILVAIRNAGKKLTPPEVGAILVFVAQIKSARLSDTLVLDETQAYRPLHRQLTREERDSTAALSAAEVRHLYSQVFTAQLQRRHK